MTSSAVTVPLSTGTGGRSSTAIRPRSGAIEAVAPGRLGRERLRLGAASRGCVAPVDGDRDLALALDQEAGERGVGVVRHRRDRRRPTARARVVDDDLAVDAAAPARRAPT